VRWSPCKEGPKLVVTYCSVCGRGEVHCCVKTLAFTGFFSPVLGSSGSSGVHNWSSNRNVDTLLKWKSGELNAEMLIPF
jgi:hypothetical protein